MPVVEATQLTATSNANCTFIEVCFCDGRQCDTIDGLDMSHTLSWSTRRQTDSVKRRLGEEWKQSRDEVVIVFGIKVPEETQLLGDLVWEFDPTFDPARPSAYIVKRAWQFGVIYRKCTSVPYLGVRVSRYGVKDRVSCPRSCLASCFLVLFF